jgi:hypothetical protein
MRTHALELFVVVTLLTGCGGVHALDLDTSQGVTAPDVAGPARFSFDKTSGAPLWNGAPLRYLPTASERSWFGIKLVDTRPLPPEWQPETAPHGGVLVASLRGDSPFAGAGLLPYDDVVACDGEAVADVSSLCAHLRQSVDKPVTLLVSRRGVERQIQATATGLLDDERQLDVPFLFERRAKANASSLGVGPLRAIFHYRNAPWLGAPDDRYVEWGCFFDVFKYWSSTKGPASHASVTSGVTLFWVFHI